jgi:transcriptional repressor NrdR
MQCPKCHDDKISVIDSRTDGDSIRRRRECANCLYRFTTYELIEKVLPFIIKKNGERQPYESAKVKEGVIRACVKRPVAINTIEKLLQDVEVWLQGQFTKEVASKELGEQIMKLLKSIDEVAYIRFASVYQEFSDGKQFLEILRKLDR